MIPVRRRTLAAMLLGATLVTLSLLKWLDPASASTVPPWSLVVVTVLEALAGTSLLMGRVLPGSLVAFSISISGGFITLLNRRAPCGCFGASLQLDWRAHSIVAALIAAWAAWLAFASRPGPVTRKLGDGRSHSQRASR